MIELRHGKMTVIHPSDDVSAEELTVQLMGLEGPSYMRTARNKTRRIYEVGDESIEIGKGRILLEGSDVAIIACGVMVEQALDAADALSEERIMATVVDMHTIKPLDTELIHKLSDS